MNLLAATSVSVRAPMRLAPLLQPRGRLLQHGLRFTSGAVRVVNSNNGHASGAMPADPNPLPDPLSPQPPTDPQPTVQDVALSSYHYVTFFLIMTGGLLFVAALLFFTGDINFQRAFTKVVKRLMKTVALPQLATILSAMAFVRYGMEPVIKAARQMTKAQGPYEKSAEYYILREVYKPLEFLFLVAAVTTLAENFLPQVINIPKSVMQTVVRSTLSLTFVMAAARVVFNIKSRIVRESTWQLELKGDLTKQRRVEAVDKLMSLATIVVASIFGVKALGMDVNSVLAIGGVGGVAVGLAGREILENLFTGLIILSSNPFEVGEEVMFRPASGQVVEGIVVDVGWYRTTIRSFEREIFIIPNSVFSRNVVLNITRKQREWRFYEFLHLRLEDVPKTSAVVSDIRKILRQDNRIIQKLHRRVFLDKVTREDVSVYISFYVEAANRDAFMAVKQDLLLGFIDCVERNGARLARNKLQLEMLPSALPVGVPVDDPVPVVDVTALPAAGESTSSSGNSGNGSPPSPSSSPSSSSESPGASSGTPSTEPTGTAAAAQPPLTTAGAASNIVSAGPSPAAPGESPSSSSPSSSPPSPQNQQQQQQQTAAAPSSTVSPRSVASTVKASSSSSGSSSTAATTPTGMPSPQAVASALANSQTAAEKIHEAAATMAVSPDRIVGGIQKGSTVLGSFDDREF